MARQNKEEGIGVMADRNSVIEKIKALLSKTKAAGCTGEEEMSALAVARAWIDNHDISDDELQLSREEKAILHNESEADARDTLKIKWQLCHAVGHYCNVQIYRDPLKARHSFVGFRSDIDLAVWLLDHLSEFVHAELFKFLLDLAPDEKNRRQAIRSFVIPCAARISARLIEMCEQSKTGRTKSSKALAVIQDRAIKDFLKAKGIRLRMSRGGYAPLGDDEARAAGLSAGDRATFGKPVSGTGAALRIGKDKP
jgi:hypothetical protein